MARPKRQHPIIPIVQAYIEEHLPELADAPLHIQSLDGPPDAPRYAASAETCPVDTCPYGLPLPLAQPGGCPVLDCPLRCSLRLLLDRSGTVLEARRSGVRWK